jgi:hypothetical protein
VTERETFVQVSSVAIGRLGQPPPGMADAASTALLAAGIGGRATASGQGNGLVTVVAVGR